MRRAGPVLVAAVAAVYFAAFVHYGILLEDEGLLLLQIARTFRGEHPYLDFHTGYPPGTFYLNATLFRLFGESVIPVRVMLVAVNAASTGLLFALARPFAGSVLAAAVALGWAAYLPVFVGLFAAFNVPYPSWYGTCTFLATQLAFDRHLVTGRRLPLVMAGIAAGLAFAFKQNAGALAALACGLTLALLRAGDWDRERNLARLLVFLGGLFLLAGFTVAVTTVESIFILGPTLVLLAGRLLWARAATLPAPPLASGVALVATAMLAVSLPWLIPFLSALGVSGLLREIFLVGTDFGLVYATPYPMPIGFPDAWPALATVALAALALGGIAVERERIGPRAAAVLLALTVTGLGALLVQWSAMPEGLARAVMLQVQSLGFFAAPLLSLVVSVAWLRRLRRGDTTAGSLEPRLLGALVFALCSFAELYPRVDGTHLLIALPSGLVLAAWAVGRVADAWAERLRIPRPVLTGAMALAATVLVLAAVVPSFSALLVLRDGGPHLRRTVEIASPAAPVHLDEEHASDVRALNALLTYLRARLRPGEGLLGFPGVALVPYLLGHPSVTRHDYWYAGRPDHLEEAEVVRKLTEEPPRFVVTVNRNIGFFSNSARYYFILRPFVREHYVLTARFGRYDVLARRELVVGPPVVEDFAPAVDEHLTTRLAEPLHESRRAAIRAFLDRAETPDGVARLAAEVVPDDRSLLLLMRAVPEAPDFRMVPFLVRTFETGTWRVRAEAARALTGVALYAGEHRYLLGPRPGEREVVPDDLLGLVDLATARAWLRHRRSCDSVGAFALWLLAGANDSPAIPLFQHLVHGGTRKPYLRLLAAYGLVRLGRPEYLCKLVSLLGDRKHEYQDAVPSLLLETAAEHPTELGVCLSLGLADVRPRGREVSAWTAGAARLEGATPALREALRDPQRRVRIAAAWALGRIGDQRARRALGGLAHDADDQTRAFAREALAQLDRVAR